MSAPNPNPEILNSGFMPPQAERRFLEIEVRAAAAGETPVISGMAAVYNREAVIADFFREVIRPGAFQRVLSENPDVIGAPNHNWDTVLGRTIAGTLKLEDRDKEGLYYSITVNEKDQEAMNFYSRVQRGDIRHSSFAFTVRKELWTSPENPKDLPLRAILEVEKLYDVSPVTFPAYPTTTASVRSQAETIKQEMEKACQAASDGAEGETARVEARRKARSRTLQLLGRK
jgi:HK97 family phage prohead protease